MFGWSGDDDALLTNLPSVPSLGRTERQASRVGVRTRADDRGEVYATRDQVIS